MPEYQVKIVNQSRSIVAETFVSGESKEEVLEALAEEVVGALSGDFDWADGIEDDLA